MHRFATILTILVLTIGFTGETALAVQEASPLAGGPRLATLGLPELRISVAEDGSVSAPREIEAGRYLVVLEAAPSATVIGADLTLVQVPPGQTLEEMAAQDAEAGPGVPPAWFYEAVIAGGLYAPAGTSASGVFELTEGQWRVEVFLDTGEDESTATSSPTTDESGSPIAVEGMEERVDFEPTMLTVTGAATAIAAVDIPVDQTVELVDFDFTIPLNVAAGPQIWQVTNTGSQPHHMIIENANGPITDAQLEELIGFQFGMADASATPSPDMPNPAQFTPAGGVGVLSPGQTAWIELDLAPGTYIAICFLPDKETGMPHAAMGMYEIFTVE